MKEIYLTIESYEKNSTEYIKNTSEIKIFPDVLRDISIFLDLLKGEKVIDIAFGSGRDILYFKENGIDVSGIELTRSFIDNLKKRIDVPLYLMDMTELNLEESYYDGIWCCSSFSHIPKNDAQRTLEGFNRITKMGGLLFLSLKKGEGDGWVQKGNIENLPRFFSYYNFSEISNILKNAGFEVIKYIDEGEKSRWMSVFSRKVV